MSVIVKGMKMPECCGECELNDSDDDGIYCTVLEVFMRFDELPKGRRSDCPLAELIRCKDCMDWSSEIEQTAVPEIHRCKWWRVGTYPTDFCSRAKRRCEE